ncbi:MAG TPA: NfeD family protein [Thiothrix sp.]|nr:NfeD family protein [Thiothrix sp.]
MDNGFSMLYWHWLILGAFLIVLEIFAPGAIFMWFGFGAIITGLLLIFLPDVSLGIQVLLFASLSGISLVAWRKSPYFRGDNIPSDSPNLNNRLYSHIGKTYVLSEAAENGVGSVKVGDSTWRVRSHENLALGTIVRVIDIDGIHFIVEKAEK